MSDRGSESVHIVEEQQIISVNKFIFLSVLTFGVYELWWMYKAWRFFQQKEGSDIRPALRVVFGVIFLTSLFYKIHDFAGERGYSKSYYSWLLFVGFFITNLLSRLPEPFWLLSLLSFIFLIPPFQALNYAMKNSTDFVVREQTSFSNRQIGLIFVGLTMWVLVLMGMVANEMV